MLNLEWRFLSKAFTPTTSPSFSFSFYVGWQAKSKVSMGQLCIFPVLISSTHRLYLSGPPKYIWFIFLMLLSSFYTFFFFFFVSAQYKQTSVSENLLSFTRFIVLCVWENCQHSHALQTETHTFFIPARVSKSTQMSGIWFCLRFLSCGLFYAHNRKTLNNSLNDSENLYLILVEDEITFKFAA